METLLSPLFSILYILTHFLFSYQNNHRQTDIVDSIGLQSGGDQTTKTSNIKLLALLYLLIQTHNNDICDDP